MEELKTIEVGRQVPGGPNVAFVKVDMGAGPRVGLARVWYSVHGVQQKLGLRIDLDKRILLDRPEDDRYHAETDELGRRLFAFLATREAKALLDAAPSRIIGMHTERDAPPAQSAATGR